MITIGRIITNLNVGKGFDDIEKITANFIHWFVIHSPDWLLIHDY